MNQTEMLHQMCHEVLTEADIKAICKNRELPSQAASSRRMLETLFLTDAGVAAAMRSLGRSEIALLHLLGSQDKPVDITFFSRLEPSISQRWSYGTFTQRYQNVFTKVKDRLVRAGILLVALGPESASKTTKMERWQFALPVQFARHLPPLLESTKHLHGEGSWRGDAAREKLKMALRPRSEDQTKTDRVEIVKGELCWGGQPFRADRILPWQKLRWQEETATAQRPKDGSSGTLSPSDGVFHILASLAADLWSDPEALAGPLEVFCGVPVDAASVCESGWRWGLLARQQTEGRMWYRLAPVAAGADTPPDRYLAVKEEGVAVDLDTVPFEALEALVRMSDQRPLPGKQPLLLVTPNLIKFGRMADTVGPLGDWLQKNAPGFHQAFEAVRKRRGRTILHENLSVARVSDLSLKVALERALGKRLVVLGEEYIAFPVEAVAEVKRLVTQMGHVVKEIEPS